MYKYLLAIIGLFSLPLTSIAQTNGALNVNSLGVLGTPGVFTATPTAAVISLVTSQATGAAGSIIPLTNPTGLLVGQIASGTNIPANDQVIFVSGGTAVVSLTTPVGVPTGATYIALSNTTALVSNMYLLDNTTTAAIPANTSVIAISGNAAAPVALTGTAGAAAQQVVTVSTGGATCLSGMLVLDSTSAVIPINTTLISSTATSLTLSAAITGAGVGGADVITCYPSVWISAPTNSAVLSSDTLVFSPMAVLQTVTTGTIAAGATINFSPITSLIGTVNGTTGMFDAGVGGFSQYGNTVLKVYGNSNNKFLDGYGTDTLVGLGAGQNLPPQDYLTTAIGWHALQNTTNANTESTAGGFWSQSHITTGGYNTSWGVGTIGQCLICGHDMAFGTDSMRNTLTASYNVGYGVNTLIDDGSAGNNIALGNYAYPGNVGGIGQFNIAIGNSAFASTSLTTATQNLFIGQGAGGAAATSASNDIGEGHLTLQNITTASNVTAIGFSSGNKLTTGNLNTFYGSQSGYGVTTGAQNTIIGAVTNALINEITTGISNIIIGYNVTVPSATQNSQINLGNVYYANAGSPTISSGFGAGASIVAKAGSAAFTINVGTGGTASSGVIQMGGQPTGYICRATDRTNSTSFIEDVVTTSTAQVTITNFSRFQTAIPATPTAWTASDILEISCAGY